MTSFARLRSKLSFLVVVAVFCDLSQAVAQSSQEGRRSKTLIQAPNSSFSIKNIREIQNKLALQQLADEQTVQNAHRAVAAPTVELPLPSEDVNSLLPAVT